MKLTNLSFIDLEAATYLEKLHKGVFAAKLGFMRNESD
jgi:hypothetical protein